MEADFVRSVFYSPSQYAPARGDTSAACAVRTTRGHWQTAQPAGSSRLIPVSHHRPLVVSSSGRLIAKPHYEFTPTHSDLYHHNVIAVLVADFSDRSSDAVALEYRLRY